ncbi:class I SAM-dependent methyltransferase [Shewanella cyperi]|uniref:Class I SAM-dependent methyltransferase n=2 Tax=Shewanella TaxID=22 RepID=A0A974XPS6_9GAMM|nr:MULTISPECIES: class I SAM-dependent methyltransferase [Shewanella]QSX31031.1 class I SAM-dependent methyltransferase [Shewanella cyperi]QSX38260.1 class I SAM-dependent methyltransferase [Shewanella sedimentimangrovi]
MNWKFSYAIGFHPWEDTDQEFSQSLASLLEREEEGRAPPYGRALDVGSGSAIWGIELAKRGWDVTGVELVDKALERGRERIQNAGVEMKLLKGDVTRLSETEVGTGFRLILDTGTFHDFDTDQQKGMARSIDALAAKDATVILLCWPRRIRPLIRGVSREEIEAAFTGWRITDVEPSFFKLPPPLEWVLRPDEHWYRLQRA